MQHAYCNKKLSTGYGIFLEKLIVTQMFKKIPVLSYPKFNYRVRKRKQEVHTKSFWKTFREDITLETACICK
jgi:hypothetical protein